MGEEVYDFDSMSIDSLKKFGLAEKGKPKKTTGDKPAAAKPADPKPEGPFKSFPHMFIDDDKEKPSEMTDRKPSVETPKPKPTGDKPVEEKPATEKPKVVVEKLATLKTEELSIGEIGSKIDELMSEDTELRSTFATMSKEKQEKIIERLNAIAAEYNKYVKSINMKLSKMVSSKDIDSMSKEEIAKEILNLRDANEELRREYSNTSNAELKVAIEKVLVKLNNRYIDLVDAYNSEKTKSR